MDGSDGKAGKEGDPSFDASTSKFDVKGAKKINSGVCEGKLDLLTAFSG